MDVQNISNLESPLYNTLVTRSQRDPWTYSLLSNIGSFSKSRVEVPPQTDPSNFLDSDQEVHWKIPRYGLLAKVCVLNRVEMQDADGSETNRADFNDAFGLYMWKELRLETHNKRIQALYPEYQYMRMQSLPYERRQSMHGAVVQNGSALASEDAALTTRQFYTPAFFAFSERTNNFIDTRFVENLEVVGIARKGSEISTLGGGDTMKFASGYPKLVCYFYNPTEEIYRAYQHRNFTLERPLTMLQYDVFRETPEVMTGDKKQDEKVNGKQIANTLTLTKKLDCNNLVFATHVMVREKSTGIAGGTYADPMSRKGCVMNKHDSTDTSNTSTDDDTIGWGPGGNPGFADGDYVEIEEDVAANGGSALPSDHRSTFFKWTVSSNVPALDTTQIGFGQSGGQFFYLKDVTDVGAKLIPKIEYEMQTGDAGVNIKYAYAAIETSGTGAKYIITHRPGGGRRQKTVESGEIGHRDHKDFLQIENIKVSGTSRELVDQPGYELLHLDNSSYGRLVGSSSAFAEGLKESSAESIYSLYWGLDNSRVACSGALSLKNLASPEIEVKVDIGTKNAIGNNYELVIFHEFWQLVSVQGSDGRVSVGISV